MIDKAKKSRGPWFRLGLALGVVLLVLGAAFGALLTARPKPVAVERSFVSYIESLAQSGKLVLAEARERLTVRETTPGLLFGDSGVGRLLGIRSDATVSATAWADLSFAVDLNATEGWAVRYLPEGGGRLELAAPPLGMLTPAILTDTIEIIVEDRSLFLDERRLEDSLLRSLTARFVEAASAMLDDPRIREISADALKDVALAYAAKAGVSLAEVGVNFAPPED